VYNLRIIGLAAQRDTQSLVKVLLKVPGLEAERISRGLKVPPFDVLSIEKQEQAEKIKSVLEKFGAICEIEDARAKKSTLEKFGEEYETFVTVTGDKRSDTRKTQRAIPVYEEKRPKFRINFWLIVLGVVALVFIISNIEFSSEASHKPNHVQVITGVPSANASPANAPSTAKSANSTTNSPKSNELKKDLAKNPYDAGAWKNLSENLEKEGDTAAARKAKESYEKAVRAQLIMASLAKAFGNDVRVETSAEAIHYRTNKNLTDEEFYVEADRLKDSLEAKFPGRDLIIENYVKGKGIQSVTLKANK
jgi:hypothetical protein